MKKLILTFLLISNFIFANEVDVLNVKYNCSVKNICSFAVTLKHNDTSWKHYANKFDIIVDDKVIATRVLRYPHIQEQPFTRGISNVKIPNNTKTIKIQGHDLVHKYGGKTFLIKLK